MHWTTRGWGRAKPPSVHLGVDGKECGCYSEDSGDDYSGYKRRGYTICIAHKEEKERYRIRREKESKIENAYNRGMEHRLTMIREFVSEVTRRHLRRFKREILDVEDDIVPIKYLYERHEYRRHDVSSIGHYEKKCINVQKINGRYYCCKNKIMYYEKWYKKIDEDIVRDKQSFMRVNKWTEDDIVFRSYNWIKINDNNWLKEYKSYTTDDYEYLVRMMDKMDISDNGIYETDGECDDGYVPEFMR